MALRFYFGSSDGELSKQVYQEVIARSLKEPEQNFLVVVPDQFTMQTQKDLSLMHPRGGILNIDVLSFGRLGHRVLEEVDCREVPVLDDTGKNLVLQKIQSGLKEELPVLGSFLHKQGYVKEVKSAISEFMQYGVSPKDLDDLMEFAKEKKALAGKLRDLQVIYARFLEYIQDHFVTAEETLDILCRNLSKSKLVRDSVIVLDGFTGFTPIQYRLVRELALLGREVIVTLVLGDGEDPYLQDGEQKLFALTKKTVADLERILSEAGIPHDRKGDVCLPKKVEKSLQAEGKAEKVESARADREAETGAQDGSGAGAQDGSGAGRQDGSGAGTQMDQLGFLRQHLFRYDKAKYENGPAGQIRIFEMTNPSAEVHQVALQIQRLLREKQYAYRDIVLITGDLEGYAPFVESEFARLGIPCFIDRTRSITLNPLTEFLLSGLNLSLKNFSYEAVFHYLRSGMTGISADETDRLENYVIEMGIRGKKAWQERFAKKTKAMQRRDPKDETALEALNRTREIFVSQVRFLSEKKKDTAAGFVDRVYDFLVEAKAEQKLLSMAKTFEEQGDASRAKEYSQIYRLVMELLNQIYQLLGEEEVTLQEFTDILSAGLSEIQVGIIPQNVDRILVGDMERTRFKPVKALFFLGINDGIIPRNTSKGGILSDVEREFLKDSSHALAPTPRELMFIQRFYLYLNLTKPTERLFLSYSRQGSDGKAMRPAYLLDAIRRLFPNATVEIPQMMPALEQVMTPEEGRGMLAQSLREFAGGMLRDEKEKEFYTLYEAYGGEEDRKKREQYLSAAFLRHKDARLLPEISRLIYGQVLENSVSRLETFAACAYRHFLKYGLSLREREQYGFEAVDLGNVYHGVLEEFSNRLGAEDKTWFTFDEEFARRAVAEAMKKQAAEYHGSILENNHRNEYQVRRMERILLRTVMTMQKQLKKGVFTPLAYELKFRQVQELGEGGGGEPSREQMKLVGIIDRVDIAEDADHVYVKIMDYKSGDRRFDLLALYHGLQLQLVVYVNAAMEKMRERYPEKTVVPAALLYYHLDDPIIEESGEMTEEELGLMIDRALRAKGIVNDSPEIVRLLDGEFSEKSDAIPVERKKDGNYTAKSSVMNAEDLKNLSSFVSRKLQETGRKILGGSIDLNPYERGEETACKYCPYGKVCGFDAGIPGCEKRVLEDISDEEILKRMGESAGQNAGQNVGEAGFTAKSGGEVSEHEC